MARADRARFLGCAETLGRRGRGRPRPRGREWIPHRALDRRDDTRAPPARRRLGRDGARSRLRRDGGARPPPRSAGPAAAVARSARAGGAGGPPRHPPAPVPRSRHGRTLTMAPVPVSVLTGFLGSGKTTLLARLLRDPALARTAVIVNEFGAVGLDHLLVEAADEEILLLDSGCVCCSVRGDLVRTAGSLLARRAAGAIPPFERIVIETTGLADPAPILQALMTDPAIADSLCLESVIATVDAAAGAATLDAHPESVKQAAIADRIVVTKTDLADPVRSGLLERLAALNPAAPKLTAAHGAVDARRLFGGGMYDASARTPDVRRWLAAETFAHNPGGHDHDHRADRHDDAITSFCLRRSGPLRAVTLALFLQVLAEHCGARLLRLKGLVDVLESPGRPAVIHGVQHVFHPPAWLDAWPDEDRTTRIVVIARGLDPLWVEARLDASNCEVAAVQAHASTTAQQEREAQCSIS